MIFTFSKGCIGCAAVGAKYQSSSQKATSIMSANFNPRESNNNYAKSEDDPLAVFNSADSGGVSNDDMTKSSNTVNLLEGLDHRHGG